MKYYIYWLHLPEHIDYLNEGYIGVSINPTRRFEEHKTSMYNNHLFYAFKKYKDSIILDILFDFDNENQSYNKEKELRPQEQIGWNITFGGNKPPKCKKGQGVGRIMPIHKNKDKTYDEIYGEEKSNKTKNEISSKKKIYNKKN